MGSSKLKAIARDSDAAGTDQQIGRLAQPGCG
jgi:hypothetical protein